MHNRALVGSWNSKFNEQTLSSFAHIKNDLLTQRGTVWNAFSLNGGYIECAYNEHLLFTCSEKNYFNWTLPANILCISVDEYKVIW